MKTDTLPAPAASLFTAEQTAELIRLKAYFPFRIVWGAIKGAEFQCAASFTKREANRLARDGWTVAILG